MGQERPLAINELSNFLRRSNQGALDQFATAFPEFSSELTKGVPLGAKGKGATSESKPSPDAQEASNQTFIEKRAKLALGLAKGVIDHVSRQIGSLEKKVASQRLRKIVLLSVGGLSGVGTLAAIGFSPDVAARVGAIFTSLVSIGSAIHEYLVKGVERNLETGIMKLAKAKFSLVVLIQELEAALESRIDAKRIEQLVNKANGVAEELNGDSTLLGL